MRTAILISGVLATSLGAVPLPPARGLEATDALSVLLTAESLLFAVFGISVALTDKVGGGRVPFVAEGLLAWSITVVIAVVAVGAGAAWIDVYTPETPNHFVGWAEGIAIALAIVLEVVLAACISWTVSESWRQGLGGRWSRRGGR